MRYSALTEHAVPVAFSWFCRITITCWDSSTDDYPHGFATHARTHVLRAPFVLYAFLTHALPVHRPFLLPLRALHLTAHAAVYRFLYHFSLRILPAVLLHNTGLHFMRAALRICERARSVYVAHAVVTTCAFAFCVA